MKLWRLRHGFSWSTLALEITVRRALDGRSKADLGVAMRDVFNFVVGNLQGIRLIDPANSNNQIASWHQNVGPGEELAHQVGSADDLPARDRDHLVQANVVTPLRPMLVPGSVTQPGQIVPVGSTQRKRRAECSA